jgi:signal transduction histidine kinase
MTPQAEETPDLAAVLDRHREGIAVAWAERVRQLSDSHYRDRPPEELHDAALRCLDAIQEVLRTGSDAALDSYLIDVSLSRLRQHFDIAEVIEGLLLWRETALPFVLHGLSLEKVDGDVQKGPGPFWQGLGYPQNYQRLVDTCLAQLDGCVRHLVARFGHLYAEAVHRQMEEQRQRTAVVEERQRLARELHDSVTQSLYSITLFAEAATDMLVDGKPDQAAAYLRELSDTARESLREMRLLIFELHPPLLEKEGLAGALQARLEAVETRGGLHAELWVVGEGRLPIVVEEGLYRIAQEALNNVLKHSKARRVTVRLQLSDGAACLEVADDGVGFDPRLLPEKGGLGLSGMQERAEQLGAKLVVESRPGNGTTVRVEVGNMEVPRWAT